jgi:hypothetical protein
VVVHILGWGLGMCREQVDAGVVDLDNWCFVGGPTGVVANLR